MKKLTALALIATFATPFAAMAESHKEVKKETTVEHKDGDHKTTTTETHESKEAK